MTEYSVGSQIRSRFWGYIGDQLTRYGNLEATSARLALTTPGGGKLPEYIIRWAYYENKRLYYLLKQAKLIEAAMPTEWNPVPATTAFYVANTLGGELDIVLEEDNPKREAVKEAIKQIWEWSNFDVLKGELTETAAVLADIFLKVAERRPNGDDGETEAMFLQIIPPETIRHWKADERGYLTLVRIDTPRTESIFTGDIKRHVLVEYWQKSWEDGVGGVRYYEVKGSQSPTEDENLPDPVRVLTFDELGYDFIPIVWAQARTYWWDVTDQIDRYNALALKVDRLNRPTGVIHGRHVDIEGRPMPAPRINTEEVETTYQEAADGTFGWIRIPGNSQFEWATSPIDLATTLKQMENARRGVETALPEYRVAELDATQIAADTLERLLDQAGQRVLDMRRVLERGLERAQMMALTIGQAAGLDLCGRELIGSWEEGTLAHSFAPRPVFKMTLTQAAAILKEFVAAGIPTKLAMKKVGFTDEEIEEFEALAAEESLRRRTTLAAQLSRQQALFDSGEADNDLTQV